MKSVTIVADEEEEKSYNFSNDSDFTAADNQITFHDKIIFFINQYLRHHYINERILTLGYTAIFYRYIPEKPL